jgi:TolA protein
MSAMSNKLNLKLSLPVIISIILHGILILILGYQFILDDNGENYGNIDGNSINAIMVDPSVMAEQYQRQLQSQANQQKADKQRQEQLDNQIKELAAKAAAEKAAAEKAAAEKAAAEKAAAEKVAAEKVAAEKAAAEKATAEKVAAEKAAAEKVAAEKAAAEKVAAEKAAAEKAAAEKAAVEKKAAAEKAAAARKAEQAKKDRALNDLLGDLTSSSPSVSGGTASRKGTSDGELDKYKSLVQNAISNKFINPMNVYRGKTCELQIQIAPDGLLLNVTSNSGDIDLCREALAATKLTVIPKPASNLYNEVKTMEITFQPN